MLLHAVNTAIAPLLPLSLLMLSIRHSLRYLLLLFTSPRMLTRARYYLASRRLF